MKLHELHRRRLESTVQLIEAAMARIEAALQESGGIVHAIENSLSPRERDAVLDHIQRVRAAIATFACTFGLERRSIDVHQIIAAELSTVWVMLENCRPKRMKGYGVEFDGAARAALEEALEKLLAEVESLRSTVG
jgi:enoyl-[acyl-carrier-protein] reductase (NADH)